MADKTDVDQAFDLGFLEDSIGEIDEIDAVSSRVISFEEDTEIPTKYLVRKIFSPHLEPPYHYHPAGEKTHRRKKVKSTWGQDASDGRSSFAKQDDILALLTFASTDVSEISAKAVHKITQAVSKLSGDNKAEAIRKNGLEVILKMHSLEQYEALGKAFTDGKIDDLSGLKLSEIQAIMIVDPPHCYIELSCDHPDGAKLQREMSSLLVPYCSKFPFLTIREPLQKVNGSSPTNSPASKQRRLADSHDQQTVPAIGIMLMFAQTAKRNADKALKAMRAHPTLKQAKLPKEITEEDEVHFKLSSESNGLLLSLKQSSPFAGVRITVIVNKNLEQVERFYSLITGKTPLAYNKIEEGLSCRTYPLSRKLELQLVSHPQVKSHQVQHIALCFAVEDMNQMCSEIPGGVRNIGEGHWHVTDPDGNSVILYSLLQ
ncbi:uncharacterized protein LOC5509774 [Nematostella vectensis]|uniref:uncharacterized protein LOC5509774 n=1 Tax=Nematostella vectensis TaxID=45351 RepID=UPI002076E4C5|nr:uncharacterized protein LOC5509774 [Nematostella vectensis]